MMGSFRLLAFAFLLNEATGFTPSSSQRYHRRSTAPLTAISRRSVMIATTTAVATGLVSCIQPDPALAIPMITTEEFMIILRDSARSIRVVEFSGPLSETVTVRLVDGTAFGLKDVIESPSDPRSPLKVSASCRAYQVPVKFANIEAILAAAPKKKKVFTNERVLEANQKEKERLARMAKDEEDRLAELYRMEGMQQQQ